MKKILLTAAVTLPLLAGCETLRALSQASLSPEQVEQLDTYTAEIAEKEKIIEGLEAQVADLTVKTAEELAEGDASQLANRVSLLMEIQELHSKTVEEYKDAIAQEREIIASGTRKVTDGFLAVAAPFIPAPIQPLLPFASSLLVLALSSRARKHTGKAIAATAKGALGDAMSSILKAVGAKHTSETPEDILQDALAAAQAAYARGEITLEKLEAVKAAVSASQVG
jgi:hypothetical protein